MDVLEDEQKESVLVSEVVDESDIAEDDALETVPKNFKTEPADKNLDIKKFQSEIKVMEELYAYDSTQLKACTVVKHTIRIQPGTPPINVPPYRRSQAERRQMQVEIDAVTITETWPIPNIHDILDNMSGSVYFSAMDLTSGYFQILLDEESRKYTAFSTQDGHYEYVRMAQGLKNAPAAFSYIMNTLLGQLRFVQIYLDDITIHSRTIQEHYQHIREVARILKGAGLRIKPTKCTWCAKEVKDRKSVV